MYHEKRNNDKWGNNKSNIHQVWYTSPTITARSRFLHRYVSNNFQANYLTKHLKKLYGKLPGINPC